MSNGIQKMALRGWQQRWIQKMALRGWQQRVVDERVDLAGRIERLCAFVGSEPWLDLPRVEKDRLRRQLTAMEAYDSALLDRIAAFGALAKPAFNAAAVRSSLLGTFKQA